MARWTTGIRERVRQSLRSFVLGPGVVDATMQAYGVGGPDSQFAPEEYGEYIAKSNGVYACATGRADLLSSLPQRAMKLRNGKREEVTQGNLVQLLTKVNPHWTMNRLISMTELSLCLWGKAFWFLERGPSGTQTPREIWWGRPDRVVVYPDPVNYIKGFAYTPMTGGTPIGYLPSEVIWFRYPNPMDEYDGLSPLAASRIAADYAGEAWRSNRNLFRNGLQTGGLVIPKQNTQLTEQQAGEIEALLDQRFKGVDKAHRWGVFRFEVETKALGISPHDAEFIQGIQLSLEEICRAYKWPQDLAGGKRTYENFPAAMRAAWTHAVLPEARFIAGEITEQLVPMFGGEADLVEFDDSEVADLQEAKTDRWTRAMNQIDRGAMLINEWREEEGKKPLPWGDTWWAPGTAVPVEALEEAVSHQPSAISSEEEEEAVSSQPSAVSPEEEEGKEPRSMRSVRAVQGVEYRSAEHERAWKKFDRRASRWERVIGEAVAELMRSQKESVLSKLEKAERSIQSTGQRADLGDLFNLADWIKRFRVRIRPKLRDLVQETGEEEYIEMGTLNLVFDVSAAGAARFIERRAQRFAKEVNETTWKTLQKSLSEGIEGGEGLVKLQARVEAVMGDRIQSSSEAIARTEVTGAMNGGRLEAWKQTGLKIRKTWLAELDDRARDSHVEAHRRYQNAPIDMDEDFEVGSGRGPGPGQLGAAEEDINCRCTMQPVVEDEEE